MNCCSVSVLQNTLLAYLQFCHCWCRIFFYRCYFSMLAAEVLCSDFPASREHPTVFLQICELYGLQLPSLLPSIFSGRIFTWNGCFAYILLLSRTFAELKMVFWVVYPFPQRGIYSSALRILWGSWTSSLGTCNFTLYFGVHLAGNLESSLVCRVHFCLKQRFRILTFSFVLLAELYVETVVFYQRHCGDKLLVVSNHLSQQGALLQHAADRGAVLSR